MRFDRGKLFDGVRGWLGPLTSQQVGGLNFLVDSIEKDPHLTRIEWPAYMLATTTVETASTFQPIHEYGGHNYFVRRYGSQTAVGKRLGNLTPEEGATFAGEGDVQLTGHSNYKKATAALQAQYPELVAEFEARTGTTFDLEHNAAEAGDPVIAYAVMSYGMRSGLFTGKSLTTYTHSNGFDSYNARRIINGLDRADLIAADYKHWLGILQNALVTDTPDSAAAPAQEVAAAAETSSEQIASLPEQPPTQQEPPEGGTPSAPGPKPSLWERATSWQAKLEQASSLKNSLNPFTPSLAPISGQSWVSAVATKIGGGISLIHGLIVGNPIETTVGAVLIIAGLVYLAIAKGHALERLKVFWHYEDPAVPKAIATATAETKTEGGS